MGDTKDLGQCSNCGEKLVTNQYYQIHTRGKTITRMCEECYEGWIRRKQSQGRTIGDVVPRR